VNALVKIALLIVLTAGSIPQLAFKPFGRYEYPFAKSVDVPKKKLLDEIVMIFVTVRLFDTTKLFDAVTLPLESVTMLTTVSEDGFCILIALTVLI
jgi:hypothetical protein